jgi:hypothetical protein
MEVRFGVFSEGQAVDFEIVRDWRHKKGCFCRMASNSCSEVFGALRRRRRIRGESGKNGPGLGYLAVFLRDEVNLVWVGRFVRWDEPWLKPSISNRTVCSYDCSVKRTGGTPWPRSSL